MISEIKSYKVSLRRKANSISFQSKTKIVTLNSNGIYRKENFKTESRMILSRNLSYRHQSSIQENAKVLKRKSLASKPELKVHYTDGSFNANARIESIKNNSQGYLEVKTKKNWKRFYCILRSNVLSFYSELNSPVPTETVDITHYNFVADVKTSPDSRFAIRATQCVGNKFFVLGSFNFEEAVEWMKHFDVIMKNSQRKRSSHMEKQGNVEKTNTANEHSNVRGKNSEKSIQFHKKSLLNDLEVLKHEFRTKIKNNESETKRNAILVKSTEEHLTRKVAMLSQRRNSTQLKISQLSRELETISTSKKKQKNLSKSDSSKNENFLNLFLMSKVVKLKEEVKTINIEIQQLNCSKKSFVEKVDEQLTMKKVNPLSCSFKTSPHDQLKKALTLSLDPCASENFKRRGGSFTKLRKCLKKTKSHEFKASIRVEKPSCSSDDMNLPKDDFMKEISVFEKFSRMKLKTFK